MVNQRLMGFLTIEKSVLRWARIGMREGILPRRGLRFLMMRKSYLLLQAITERDVWSVLSNLMAAVALAWIWILDLDFVF